jgi:Lrp/AsnC family transcriptional regulator for asnA, asnC and gidA
MLLGLDGERRSPTLRSHVISDLDELDFTLITLLQEDGRRATSEIARAVQVPESTVRRRIDRLLREGFIRVVAIVEDPARMGLTVHAMFGLRVAPQDQKGVIEELTRCDEIRWVALSTGPLNVQAEGFFHSLVHLRAFQHEKIAGSSPILESQVDVVLDLFKNRYDWAAMARAQANSSAEGGCRRTDG